MKDRILSYVVPSALVIAAGGLLYTCATAVRKIEPTLQGDYTGDGREDAIVVRHSDMIAMGPTDWQNFTVFFYDATDIAHHEDGLYATDINVRVLGRGKAPGVIRKGERLLTEAKDMDGDGDLDITFATMADMHDPFNALPRTPYGHWLRNGGNGEFAWVKSEEK
ncbi:MAG TPA: hypothetical protein VJB16_01985 [archaeon]|nr:hypothetical protein [archaeon]